MRPLREVLGSSAIAGTIAGLAMGAIDAVWSWTPAAQFVPDLLSRMRFVGFTTASYGAAGAAAGVVLGASLLVLSRASRLGDVGRFAWREHLARRDRDPRGAVGGLALVIATVPCVAALLAVAYRVTVPYVTGRKVVGLVVIAAMIAALLALAAAIPIGAVIGRGLEALLRRLAARRVAGGVLSSPYAPVIAGGAMIASILAIWTCREWETARELPLRGPLVAAAGLALAVPAWARARWIGVLIGRLRPAARRALWALAMPALIGAMLATGGSPAVVKAAASYTGLGGGVSRTVRRAFDWDRDGYARFLGGGDCDDGDATVHPGAPEVPDDRIDQNCVGGDATTKRVPGDVGFSPVPSAVPKALNVLLITIDTMRADHVGSYGYARPTTPNLDKLAADATVFEHSWAHAPSTRYSIPAILTGRLPLDVYYDASVEGWPGLLPKATTIAESLGSLGFTTGAITSYWYFDRSRHMDQGFASYDNENASRHSGVAGAGPEQTKGSSSKQQTDKAIKFIEQQTASGKRWFLWVHYYDPHYAYEPHPEVASFGSDRMALYDGELLFTDLHVGRLIDELRANGLYGNTVVVVTGDHGEGFGEHQVDLHGYHLYAPQTRVPMIIRVPGIPPRRATTPVGHADILPTLVNLAGGAASPDMMGRSLLEEISGKDADRVVFQQLSYEGNHELRAGVSRQCHVIYNVSPDTSWEVYRIDRDPLETHDLADDDEACAETRRAVEHWFDAEQVPAGAAEALLSARPTLGVPLDADLGDGVRLLGLDAPATAKRGEPITLTWTFEARGSVAPGWKVFAHVEGPGKTFFNADHRPARPFEWWKAGQFIRYTTTVMVPRGAAFGRYTVWVGMFEGKHRAKASAPRAKVVDNAVAASAIEVLP